MHLRPSLIALLARFWAPLLVACAYAAWKGGKPERWGAALVLGAASGTLAVRVGFAERYVAVQPAVVLIDVLLFAALVALAVVANRGWPVLLAALHAFPLLGHFARWTNPELPRLAYAILLSGPQMPIILVLFVATARHQHRLRRSGVDADWRRSSATTRADEVWPSG